MEAIGLFFSKFSEELLSAQIALLSLCLSLSVYLLLIRKKKRETTEWVPAALVRAYLDRVRADEQETRARLFGQEANSKSSSSPVILSNDPALQREIDALRAQIATADSRALEFDRTTAGLRSEKGVLEQKLKDALTAGAAGGGEASAAMLKELEELRAKLGEYEVIEDDLASLKKFQAENQELKQRIAMLESKAALSVVPSSQPPAEAPKVEAPKPALAAVEPLPVAAPAPAAEAVAEKPAEEKSSKQKEEELLSEFEKMLAS